MEVLPSQPSSKGILETHVRAKLAELHGVDPDLITVEMITQWSHELDPILQIERPQNVTEIIVPVHLGLSTLREAAEARDFVDALLEERAVDKKNE